MTTQQLPRTFIDRIRLIYPEFDIKKILLALDKERPVTIRVNTLKTTVETVESELIKEKIKFEKIKQLSVAYVVPALSNKQVTNLNIYKSSQIYIQSLSSMLPAIILNPAPEDKILDMCAAPGSKTSQIAALINNQGEIIANDISRERLYKLKANLESQGVTNTKITSYPGQTIWQRYKEYFDKVLVDAPCSMEGRFKTSDPETYADWSEKKIKSLAKQQKWLLRSAISTTKPGGVIVYSTCTLAPEENEEVINWILEKEKGKVALEEINLNINGVTKGITNWEGKEYDQELTKTIRINPDEIMEGFYIAKLRKIKSNV